MKIDPRNDLFEFRFHFHLEDSKYQSDKYFLAHDIDEAKEMFEYACNKRLPSAMLDKVEKWNRWAEKWENVDLNITDPYLN
tara:strand:- start:1495 stop:1737 length:243 start_codon:yes stop_codon:yes gene_type:complete